MSIANFLNKGTNGAAQINEYLEMQHAAFRDTLLDVNPDFQTEKDYGTKKPGTQNMSICSAHVTNRFNCFAATLEQPFKDTIDEFPQESTGWNPARSKRLGWTIVDAFHAVSVQLLSRSKSTTEGKL
jgi:murein tripeptide amidase MpaA